MNRKNKKNRGNDNWVSYAAYKRIHAKATKEANSRIIAVLGTAAAVAGLIRLMTM